MERTALLFAEQFDSLGRALERLIDRHGLTRAGLIVAGIMLVLAMVYVRPSFPFFPDALVGGSKYYAEIAKDPFNYDWQSHPTGYRILVPLIAYMIGLGGDGITFVNLAFIFLLIFSIFIVSIKEGCSALLAFAVTAIVTTSAPVLYNLFDLWNTDAARCLAMVLMFAFRRQPLVFWAIYVLSVFIQEGSATQLAFFLLLQYMNRESTLKFFVWAVLGVGVMLAAYLPFYWQAAPDGGQPLLTAKLLSGDLASIFWYPRAWAWSAYDGLFSSLKLGWLIIALAFYFMLKERDWWNAVLIFSPAIGIAAVLLYGGDMTRYAIFAFISVMLASYWMAQRFGENRLAQGVLLLTTVNLFVPNQVLYIAFDGKMDYGIMPSLPHMLFFWAF